MENPPKTLYSKSEVSRLLGLSTRTIERWASDGRLPKPIRLGPVTVRWHVAEIERWIASRPNGVT